MTQHDPLVALQHMLDHSREGLQMIEGRPREHLDTDRQLSLALMRLLEIVGEAANRIPPQQRRHWPGIPWRDVVDLRNRLIHAYDDVNFDILWAILRQDLPPLIEALEKALAPEANES
jgi:uncharacterized protein with HEPN domain